MRPRFPQERARPQGRLRCPGVAPPLLLGLALGLPTSVQAQVRPGEQWALSDGAHVLTIETCGDSLCARLTASADPDARSACGAVILDRLRPRGGKLHGDFIDPETGARRSVEIEDRNGLVLTFLDGPTSLETPLARHDPLRPRFGEPTLGTRKGGSRHDPAPC